MALPSRLLENKTALVTGSNRGIGKAIVEVFAAQGANIWACARKQTPEFDAFMEKTSQFYQVTIKPIYFDLINEEELKQALKPLIINREKLDILVNNAGIAHGGFFQMTSLAKIKEVFEINFFSQLLLIQQLGKLMKRQGAGSIINIASIAGLDAEPGFVAYGTSKAALIYATKTLALEMANDHIRVNAIAPGLTDTEMAQQMEHKAKENMVGRSSNHRMATPYEIAQTALYLASDMSAFVNGQVMRVDGGMK
jgi:3-oxoacyl-[acyl-carrier protein] reductase